MDRRPRSDLALIYVMLVESGLHEMDTRDLDAYDVVEVTRDNAAMFAWFGVYGPGLTVRFRWEPIAEVPDLAAARRIIERGAEDPVTLIAEPHGGIDRRWIPVWFDHPAVLPDGGTRPDVPPPARAVRM